MMPNCAWVGVTSGTGGIDWPSGPGEPTPSRNASIRSRARRAHRAVSSIEVRTSFSGAGHDRHSSSTMAMSDPSAAWTSTTLSGDRNRALPSRCDLKCTPASESFRRWARLKT